MSEETRRAIEAREAAKHPPVLPEPEPEPEPEVPTRRRRRPEPEPEVEPWQP